MRKSFKKRLHSLSKRLIVLIDLGVVDRFCVWVLMRTADRMGRSTFSRSMPRPGLCRIGLRRCVLSPPKTGVREIRSFGLRGIVGPTSQLTKYLPPNQLSAGGAWRVSHRGAQTGAQLDVQRLFDEISNRRNPSCSILPSSITRAGKDEDYAASLIAERPNSAVETLLCGIVWDAA
jgi:hypothetical protein